MKILLNITLLLLVLIATFDPADKVLGLKVPAFALLIALFLVHFWWRSRSKANDISISVPLVSYVLLFSLILPLYSINVYLLRNEGIAEYVGLAFLKSFCFLFLALVVSIEKRDLLKPLVIALSLLAVVTICLGIALGLYPALLALLWVIGDKFEIFTFSQRNYGPLSYLSVFYSTSPLMVVACCHFCAKTIQSIGAARLKYGAALGLILTAMIMSGTRNAIFMSFLAPSICLIVFSKRRVVPVMIVLTLGLCLVVASLPVLTAMLDARDASNQIKLGVVSDYLEMLSSPSIFFFGQGLGSSIYSHPRGMLVPLTELTYLDFMRNFGVPVGLFYVSLLIAPLFRLNDERYRQHHPLLVAYALYLCSAATNPILISSLGILLLSAVISATLTPPPAEQVTAQAAATA